MQYHSNLTDAVKATRGKVIEVLDFDAVLVKIPQMRGGYIFAEVWYGARDKNRATYADHTDYYPTQEKAHQGHINRGQ